MKLIPNIWHNVVMTSIRNDQLAKFTDQEVYGITDYMREQYYLTNF